MARRRVTVVPFEAVFSIKLRTLSHERVACHLSHDRCCGDRRAKSITADNRCLGKPAAHDTTLVVDQNMTVLPFFSTPIHLIGPPVWEARSSRSCSWQFFHDGMLSNLRCKQKILKAHIVSSPAAPAARISLAVKPDRATPTIDQLARAEKTPPPTDLT